VEAPVDATEQLRRFLIESLRFKKNLGLSLPDGYCYLGGEDFVLDRGSPLISTSFTSAERDHILGVIEGCPEKKFRLGQCFYNAQILTAYDRTGKLTYWEGWAMGVTGIPTLHGWVTLHGKTLDLTWRTEQIRHRWKYGNRIWGRIPQGWAYYGVSFQTESLLARMNRIRATGSFLDDMAHEFPLLKEPRLRSISELLMNGHME
jgi:hypothetical protein